MPTKSYRYYDPAHQASFQHTLQINDSTKTEDGQRRWSQSAYMQDFEDAQRGQDMMHIVPQSTWVQFDLSRAKPVHSPVSAPNVVTQQINLYILSDRTWNHWGAATLTLNPGIGRSAWVNLHSRGSCNLAGSFSIFCGMEILRFNDSVLCTTVQATPESSAARFVSYSFQCETIDQANALRQALATAARESGTGANQRQIAVNSQDVIESNMEKRLSSWINAVEGQYASVTPFACPESSGTISSVPRMRRRGGIDHGNSYWDLEKARSLQEAKAELDSLQLKRLLSGVQLTV